MSRHTAVATPSVSLWASVENAVRLTFSSLRAPAGQMSALDVLDAEQARIRQNSRHWLVG